MLDETELRRRYARPEHAIGGDVAVFDRETAKRPLQRIKWQPEIKQRAKDHVARRAGKAIQIQHARNQQPKPTSDLRQPTTEDYDSFFISSVRLQKRVSARIR